LRRCHEKGSWFKGSEVPGSKFENEDEELMMRARLVLFATFLFVAGHVFAQAPPRPPQTPQAPAAPAAPAAPPAAAQAPGVPPPPPPPAPPGGPRREGQAINVRVDLNITEEGGGGAPVKKSVSAVVADGFSGYVREQGFAPNLAANMPGRSVPLNLDAYPTILANGKIRLSCSIQYNAAPMSAPVATTDARLGSGTDIKQNLVLILDSGKSLVVSQATDPISDRRVTVEVTATILR
jgi:hypothetical protein